MGSRTCEHLSAPSIANAAKLLCLEYWKERWHAGYCTLRFARLHNINASLKQGLKAHTVKLPRLLEVRQSAPKQCPLNAHWSKHMSTTQTRQGALTGAPLSPPPGRRRWTRARRRVRARSAASSAHPASPASPCCAARGAANAVIAHHVACVKHTPVLSLSSLDCASSTSARKRTPCQVCKTAGQSNSPGSGRFS